MLKTITLALVLAALLAAAPASANTSAKAHLQAVRAREFVTMENKVAKAHAETYAGLLHFKAVADKYMSGEHEYMTRASQACETAKAAAFATSQATECQAVFSDDPNVNLFQDTNEASLRTKVAAFCGSQCRADLGPQFRAMLGACTRAELAEIDVNKDTIIFIRLILTLPCLRFGGEYCFPRFVAFGQSTSSLTTFDESFLNGACHPCIRKYVLLLVALAGEQDSNREAAAGFELLCLKDRRVNTYCMLEFQRIGALTGLNATQTVQEQCKTNCIAKLGLLARAYNVSGVAGDDFKNTQLLCYRDNAGKLCFTRTMEWVNAGRGEACPDTTCPGCDAETGTGCTNQQAPFCTGDKGGEAQRLQGYCNNTMCGAVIDDFISSMGCCSNFIVDVQPLAEQASFNTWVTAAAPAGCARSFNARCVGEKITLRLTIKNLDSAWAQANAAKIIAAIKKDIAANTGVDDGYIGNTNVGSTTSRSVRSLWEPSTWFSARSTTETTITAEVDAPSANDANSASRDLNSGDFSSPKTSSLGDDAQSSQADGISVQVDSASCTSCTSATSAAPSMSLSSATTTLALALAVALLALL